MLYDLTDDYIQSYTKRESGYNIVNVSQENIESYPSYELPSKFKKLYIAIGDRPLENPEPIPSYLELCLKGAKNYGYKYFTDFVITTHQK